MKNNRFHTPNNVTQFILTAALVLCFAAFSQMGWAQTTINISESKDWRVPVGVTHVTIELWGAGGGGGSGRGTAGVGGGGGGGAYTKYENYPVTAGHIITFAVGTGGDGGTDAGNGSEGGATSAQYNGSVFLKANGGKGGKGAATAAGAGGSGGGYEGGTGYSGGDGGAGNRSSGNNYGGAGGNAGGSGTVTGSGTGGARTTSNGDGSAGNPYGGGGSGGYQATYWAGGRSGGAGAAGGVRITYSMPVDNITASAESVCQGTNVTLSLTGGSADFGDFIWADGSCPQTAFREDFYSLPSNCSPAGCSYSINTAGNIVLTTTSGDPWLRMTNLGSFSPSTYRYFQVRYRVTSGTPGAMQLFYITSSHSEAEQYSNSVALANDNNWHVITFDAGSSSNWTSSGNLTGVRFDFTNNSGVTMEIDYIALTNSNNVGSSYTLSGSASVGTHTIYAVRSGGSTCLSKAVTVKTTPTITTPTISGTTPICYGSSTTLTASATGGSGSSVSYRWNTSATTASISNVTAGSYTVTATATLNGCSRSATSSTFTVTQRPAFTSGAIATTGQTRCYGSGSNTAIGSTTAASGGDGSISYQWRKNGTDISGATSATYTPTESAAGTYTFTRWAKDNTCNTSWTQSTGSWTLTINAAPSVTVTKPTGCPNQSSYTLTANATGGTSPYTYQWSNGATGTASTSTIAKYGTSDCGHTYNYTILVTGNNGCTATETSSFTLNDNTAPVIGTIADQNGIASTSCKYKIPDLSAVTLAATTDNCGTPTFVSQSIAANTEYAQTATQQSIPVTVKVKDGCGNEQTATVNVIIPSKAGVTLSNISNTSICPGTSATLTATPSSSEGTVTYSWNTGSTSNPYTVSPTATTTYTVTATATKGSCTATDSKSVTVTVRPTFTAGAIATTGQTTCNRCTINAIGSTTAASGGDGSISYQWRKNGTAISGATSATYTPTESTVGTYTFTRWAKDNTCNTSWTQSTGSYVLTIQDAPTLSVTSYGSRCYNQSDGYITVSVTGGNPNYTLTWTGGSYTMTAAGSYTIGNLADGSYAVSVTDGNGYTDAIASPIVIAQIADQLKVTADDANFTYDGNTHSKNTFQIRYGSETKTGTSGVGVTMANGDVVTATITGTIATVAQSPVTNTVGTVTVTRGGSDITCYYNVNKQNGTLTMGNSSSITLTLPNPSSRKYDGTPFAPTATATGLGSDVITVEYSTNGGSTWTSAAPSLTHVSEGPQTVTVRASCQNYTSVQNTYTLAIIPRSIILTSGSSSKVYDGTPLTNSTVTQTGDGFVGTEGITFTATGSQTELGTSDNNINYSLTGGAVATDYDITLVKGTLSVNELGITNDGHLADYNTLGTSRNETFVNQYGQRVSYGALNHYGRLLSLNYITFIANGCAGTMDRQAVTHGMVTPIAGNEFTHDNWSFVGWDTLNCSETATYADRGNITMDDSVTLYAKWHTWCNGTAHDNEAGTSRIDSVQDHEGNWYKVVQVGIDCWMKENMRATSEPTAVSTSILQNPHNSFSYSEPRAYYYGDNAANGAKYGCLYNFPAAMNINDLNESFTYPHQGICPEGWHVPQEAEWDTLATSAGCTAAYGSGTGLGKLTGGCNWATYGRGQQTYPGNYSYSERNSSGFTALPTGYYSGNDFFNFGDFGAFWISTPNGSNYAYYRTIDYNYLYVYRNNIFRYSGFSVRCIRDNSSLALGNVSMTNSTPNTLSISTNYTTSKPMVSASICAYTDAACTVPAGTCAADVQIASSPITGTITGLDHGTQYYVKVVASTIGGIESMVGGPFRTKYIDTITFVANGGAGTMGKQTLVRGEATPLATNTLSHANWSFLGWGNSRCNDAIAYADQANITTNGNVTLYAKWHTWCTGAALSNEAGTFRIDSVKDHQDHWYKVVQIGDQCWLRENMRATSEPTAPSTSILQNPHSSSSYSEPRAYYYDDNAANYAKYGCLYNFPAAMNINDQRTVFPYPHRGICPEGWHVPQDAEWDVMATVAGCTAAYGSGTGLGKLTGGCDWSTYGSGQQTYPGNYSYSERNSSGFSALPNGCYNGSDFYYLRERDFIWSSTPNGGNYAIYQNLMYNYEYVYRVNGSREYGLSVRCVRDDVGIAIDEVRKTDSTATTLSISAPYTATDPVTSATICAYSDANYTVPVGTCAADVQFATSPITGTITGLNHSTQYYVKVTATTANGTAINIGGPFKTQVVTMSISSNPASSSVGLCGASSVQVVYTANLTGATASSYTWNVTGGTGNGSTSNTFAVTAGAGTINVTCTADGLGVSATKSTTITSGGTPATMELCENYATPSVTISSTDCTTASLVWKNSSNETVLTGNTTLSAATASGVTNGYYTVSGVNSSNCSITKSVHLGASTSGCAGIARSNETDSDGVITQVRDHQNNAYNVVSISGFCIMAQNLRCTTSPAGHTLSVSNGSSNYNSYYFQNTTFGNEGYLYNWRAALDTTIYVGSMGNIVDIPNRRGLCPQGWHLPIRSEWNAIVGCHDAGQFAAPNGSYTGTNWISSYTVNAPGNTSDPDKNATGFSGIPLGRAQRTDDTFEVGEYAHFWTAANQSSPQAYVQELRFDFSNFSQSFVNKHMYYSIRCVRDVFALTLGAVRKTDSTATTLSISADYTATQAVTSATICAYTDAACTIPAGTCAADAQFASSPITGTITGLNHSTQYYVKVIATTVKGTESVIAGPYRTAPIIDTITFIPNGGTGTMTKQTATRGTATAINTNAYTHTGNWSFTGWNDACDGNGTTYADGANITTNGNVTLYAQWHTWCTGTAAGNESGTARIDSVKDHQDHWYKVVQIGTGANTQCWLKENMRCSTSPKARLAFGGTSGQDNYNPLYYNYTSNPLTLRERGYLYNWAGVMDSTFTTSTAATSKDFPNRRGICPQGWHLPTDAEWKTLERMFLTEDDGTTPITDANLNLPNGYRGKGAGKFTGGCSWSGSSSNGTSPNNYSYADRNTTGFSMLPAGLYDGNFSTPVTHGCFWSSTSTLSNAAWTRTFRTDYESVNRNDGYKDRGRSVRCIRNVITMANITKTDSTMTELSISVPYTATEAITSATICAYTDAACTVPAGTCAADVQFATSPITGTITGLNHSTQYYVKVTATTANGTAINIGGPFKTQVVTMSISSNPASSSVGLCGASSVQVVYTANLTGATASSYTWSVTGGTGNGSTSNTFAVTAGAGTINVTCTAGGLGVSATKSTTITSGGTPATMTLCEDYATPSVTVSSTNCTTASLVWKNSSNETVLTGNTTLSAATASGVTNGYYTVSGVNSSNCSITKSVHLGASTSGCAGIARANETASDGVITQVRDHQNNAYNVVSISGFCIMAQNLRCTTSPAGHPFNTSWTTSTSKSCYIQNTDFGDEGYLYNWRAALDTTIDVSSIRYNDSPNRRGLCPQGWHLPTRSEWESIVGCHDAGQFAAANGSYTGTNWDSYSSADTPGYTSDPDRNATGFSGVPVGYCPGVDFNGYGTQAIFWSATPQNAGPYYRRLYYKESGFSELHDYYKFNGFSIRCVRDN